MDEVRVSLREWQSLRPSDGVPELRGFRFDDPADRRLAEQLTETNTIELREMHDGLHIRARAHVGRLRIGRLTLTITPKVGTSELLTLFRYAFGLKHSKPYEPVGYATTGELFADLVVAQLVSEARAILDRGLAYAYVRRAESLASPRGRIQLEQIARQGGVIGASLPCAHHPRSSDHLLNQVMLAGLELGRSIASDRTLRADASRQHALLSTMATPAVLSGRLLDRAARSINRLVERYESVVRLTEILYFCTLVDLDDTGTRRLPGFLFDMNMFFQRLLHRFLVENLPDHRVEAERGLTGMMSYVPGENPRRRKLKAPRPDYAVRSGNRTDALLDAKYIDLWEHPVPSDIVYQLTVYALSQPRGSTAAILFPTVDAAATAARIEIRDPLRRSSMGYVAIRPVHLPHLAKIAYGWSTAERAERRRFASQLALGRDDAAPHARALP